MSSSADPPRRRKRRRAPKSNAPKGPAGVSGTKRKGKEKGEQEPKKEVKYAAPGDPNYLNPDYHPILEPGETWFVARRRQVEAIKVEEARLQAERAAKAAAQKAWRDARRSHVESITDLINARPPPAATPPGQQPVTKTTAVGDGTMPYQDNSPLQTPARVWGQNGDGSERSAKRRARHGPIAATRQILSGFSLSLRQAFPELIPLKPYCANELGQGIWIWPRHRALTCLHVQFNHPAVVRWLVVDIDRRGGYLADEDALLPAFNIVMVNPDNGHAHAAYVLDVPVGRHDAAHLKPLKLLAAVERGLTRRLGGDRGYAGLLSKNPLHSHWTVEWRRDDPYSLEVLSGWLTKEDMRPDPMRASFGLGRNCAIFDELRALAYRDVLTFKQSGRSEEAWRRHLFNVAWTMNGQFPDPLGDLEVRGIAKSVAKWTWRHFTEDRFATIQSKRAQLRWQGHEAERATKPWLKLGISRRTYYRRKKYGR